ncbi:MAG: hypothetical protein KJZ84_02930 [Bryobacteraceae bacterium]|nr:hypothetical protein [Bryobacteraceae bacterium]
MIRTALLLGSLILTLPAAARPPEAACGTSRFNHLEAAFLHEKAQIQAISGRVLAESGPVPVAFDSGDVAVLDGSLGVIAEPNLFNLNGRTLRFTPEPGGYRLSIADNTQARPRAEAGTPLEGLGDDESRAIRLPFPFDFYGTSYREALVHSDGNLTFRTSDAGPSARTLGRLVAGPPRIAAVFADLDPSRAPGSVRVLQEPGRVTIGWIETPAFGPALFARRQTFEITLETGGAIEMAFYDVNIAAHVTGMGPGGLGGRTRVVTLAGAGGERFDATVAEPYSQVPQLDTARLAQRFYETHDDGFDYLVVFNTAGLAAAPNAVATQTTVRSFTHGIGDFLIENGQIYGSGRRLQAFLNMGQLRHYPLDPNAPVGPRGRLTGDTTLSLLAHEAGHLFLALASVRAPGNPEARPMLSPDLAHWSFNFNSDASVLEGNRIEDAGEGAADGRFLTAGAVERYSVWDRYLMGLIAPDEVQPSFVVWPSTIPASRLPQTGLRFNGQRLDVRIEDLIEAEGPRAPSHELAQRRFRFAFILVSEPGRTPTEAEIAQVDTYRRAFVPHFHEISGGQAWADTSLRGSLGLSAWPMAGLLAGGETVVRVSRPRVEAEPLAVGVHTTNGHLEAPRDVRIAAGLAEARFELTARSAGYADVIAEPRSGDAAPVFARVKVAASPADLELRLHYQEGPLVFVRATDWEDVSFGGVALRVTGARCVAPANCRTGPDGLLQLHAPQGATVEIEGAPGSAISIQP